MAKLPLAQTSACTSQEAVSRKSCMLSFLSSHPKLGQIAIKNKLMLVVGKGGNQSRMGHGQPKGSDSRRDKENAKVFYRTDTSNRVALPERCCRPGRAFVGGLRSSFSTL